MFHVLHESVGPWGLSVFFALSGFLVSHSFYKNGNLVLFCWSRILRIFPPLLVCVSHCVFVIGPLYTEYPLVEYFSDESTYLYLLHNTLLYDLEYYLPGVFLDNPLHGMVNGALWMLPALMIMYMFVALVGWLSILRRPAFFNVLFICISAVYYFCSEHILFYLQSDHVVMGMHLIKLCLDFLLGMFFFVNRGTIILSGYMVILLLLLPIVSYQTSMYWVCFQVALVYSAIWFAFVPSGVVHKFNRIEDYSYGIYLYGFPIQQSILASIPYISGAQLIMYSCFPTAVCAILSRHLIEDPAFSYREKISKYLSSLNRVRPVT